MLKDNILINLSFEQNQYNTGPVLLTKFDNEYS